jgi:aminoglycoside phosphotransferase (APT) family kinase protein
MTALVATPVPDWPQLGRWLEAHAEGFHGLRQAERFVGGNSNPIWMLQADSGRYVLRTQPAGTLLKSAHALDREVRVLRALAGTNVPVARVRAACDDPGVIGVGFYLMDCVEGEVHRNPGLPGIAAARRRRLYEAALRNLARVHAVDIAAAGLRDFGRPGHYFQRQLHRWTQQARTALPEGDPHLDALIAALEAAMPEDPGATVLLHGDSRLDNLMFKPGSEDLAAVLDWELSTLGDPLADLGQFLAVQALPADYGLPGLAGVDRAALGIPTAAEQTALYFSASGRPAQSLEQLRFHLGFAMFRQAAMSAGLKRRALQGTAVAESALYFGNTLDVFARTGLELLQGDRIP